MLNMYHCITVSIFTGKPGEGKDCGRAAEREGAAAEEAAERAGQSGNSTILP